MHVQTDYWCRISVRASTGKVGRDLVVLLNLRLLTCIAPLSCPGGHITFFRQYLVSASENELKSIRKHQKERAYSSADSMLTCGCRFVLRR